MQGSSPPPAEVQLPVSTGWFELHQGLFNALPQGVVELGRSFSGFEERADGALCMLMHDGIQGQPLDPSAEHAGSSAALPEVLAGNMAWLACMVWQARQSAYRMARRSRPAA